MLYTDESADRDVVLTHSWNERDDLIPPAPRLTEPINGEPVAGTQPIFCWDPVPDAVDYQFELCPSDDMRYALSPVFEKLVSNTPFAGQTRWSPPENGQLNPEHTYFWRVRARAAKKAYGGPGATRIFHTIRTGHSTRRRATYRLADADSVAQMASQPTGQCPRTLYRLCQRRARFQRARR